MSKVQNVFLVGAKSLGAYGGYETFVYKLTEYHQNNPNIKYHVACKANGDKVCLFFKHYKYEITLPRSKRVYTANDINFIGYDLIIVGADEEILRQRVCLISIH